MSGVLLIAVPFFKLIFGFITVVSMVLLSALYDLSKTLRHQKPMLRLVSVPFFASILCLFGLIVIF